MGTCLSVCLPASGHWRSDGDDDDDDLDTQNLFDDPNHLQYGSFDQHHMHGQEDPLQVQREIEALQRIIARTSDNLIDIFEFGPHERIPMQDTSSSSAAASAAAAATTAEDDDDVDSPYSFTPGVSMAAVAPGAHAPGQHDVRTMRYQTLLSKLAMVNDGDDAAAVGVAHVDWGDGADRDNGDDNCAAVGKGKAKAKAKTKARSWRQEGGGEPLVGNFSDAAAAMR